MKLYVLLGNPDNDSFNAQMYHAYIEAAKEAGHEVRAQQLGSMKFDPILWLGYKKHQALEPDLLEAQQNITWCEKWVIIYPIWWGNLPALLKGFIDRTLYSGFAYKYHPNDPFWDKLLKGRTAHIITTSDAPSWWVWWQYGNSDIKALKKATLEFCGIQPVKVNRFDKMRFRNSNDLAHILAEVKKLVK